MTARLGGTYVLVLCIITDCFVCNNCYAQELTLPSIKSGRIARQRQRIIARKKAPKISLKRKKKKPTKVSKYCGDIIKDAFYLHRNLFHWDSFKIITLTFPFFIGTRMVDEKLQNCFYDVNHHKNINGMPHWAEEVAKFSLSAPIVFLGLHAFFGKTEDLRETSRVFLIGMPFVIWSKDLIKNFKFDACFRPWHEKFSKEKRSCGGFPSGHMAEAAFTAILYGMRYGPKFAVPLGLVAAFVGVTFLTNNRHYISQLVAGAGLGAMYALAADKLINKNLGIQDLDFGITVNQNGPALNISYRF